MIVIMIIDCHFFKTQNKCDIGLKYFTIFDNGYQREYLVSEGAGQRITLFIELILT